MKTFYHVTLLNNLNSIMTSGLIPHIGHLATLCDETKSRVYLFPTQEDMETALSSWLGEAIEAEFGEKVECCSLKIQLPDNFPITEGDVEYECYCEYVIPPKYITYFKNE